ncbi:MAG: hypothetical protein PF450_09595, partial [Bacteroidales bacterium]|jgi:putative protease|nr:hypothetical protein [Bacteroidales bacterium]
MELRRISLHNASNAKIDETHYLPFRYPITIHMSIENNTITLVSSHLPSWLEKDTTQHYVIDISEARKEQPLAQNIETIFTTGLHEKVNASHITINNKTPYSLHQLFIPLSALKEVRRSYYQFLEECVTEAIQAPHSVKKEEYPIGETLPNRSLITPPHNRNLPYVDLNRTLKKLKMGTQVEEVLSVIDEKVYIPLPPVWFNEEEAIQQLDEILTLLTLPVVVGINNVSHIEIVKPYAHVETFIDVYLYIANIESARLMSSSLKKLVGGYYWIERSKGDTSSYPIRLTEVEKEFSLPLFISRSCYRYDVLGLSCKQCTRDDSYEVTQRENRYSVDIHNCISVVSKK